MTTIDTQNAMSESSASFHIPWHSAHAESTIDGAIASAGLNGVIFAPLGRWRTFVAFEDVTGSESTEAHGALLSVALNMPILEYVHAEDFGWAFVVWERGEVVCGYTCTWTRRKVTDETADLHLNHVAPLLAPGASLDDIEALLRPTKLTSASAHAAPEKFAQLLGLTRYEWLGPDTLVDELDEVLESGEQRLVGTRPATRAIPAWVPPEVRKIDVDLTDACLSAHDALALIQPHADAWSSDHVLLFAQSSPLDGAPDERTSLGPWIDEHGRTTRTGGWSFHYTSPALSRRWSGAVIVSRNQLVLTNDPFPPQRMSGPLPTEWLDSPAVIAITEPLYLAMRTVDTPPLKDRVMTLATPTDSGRWSVLYMCAEPYKGRVDFCFEIDAVTGEVLLRSQA